MKRLFMLMMCLHGPLAWSADFRVLNQAVEGLNDSVSQLVQRNQSIIAQFHKELDERVQQKRQEFSDQLEQENENLYAYYTQKIIDIKQELFQEKENDLSQEKEELKKTMALEYAEKLVGERNALEIECQEKYRKEIEDLRQENEGFVQEKKEIEDLIKDGLTDDNSIFDSGEATALDMLKALIDENKYSESDKDAKLDMALGALNISQQNESGQKLSVDELNAKLEERQKTFNSDEQSLNKYLALLEEIGKNLFNFEYPMSPEKITTIPHPTKNDEKMTNFLKNILTGREQFKNEVQSLQQQFQNEVQNRQQQLSAFYNLLTPEELSALQERYRQQQQHYQQ